MLHVPFRTMEDLLRLDDLQFKTFTTAFGYQQEAYGHNTEPDYMEELPPKLEDD